MMRWKKLLTRPLLLAAVLTALTVSAQADAVTDTIGVYIGYFGWSEDQYVEKAAYHWTQLDDWYGGALDTHEVVYSYYNGSREEENGMQGRLIVFEGTDGSAITLRSCSAIS